MTKPIKPIEIVYLYAKEGDDKSQLQRLEKQLRNLKRSNLIIDWGTHQILPGSESNSEIDKHLNTAQIILLLISPDFFASDDCYSQMEHAIKRHAGGEAIALPVIVRPVDLRSTPLREWEVLPTGGKPVTKWTNRDEAFLDISQGVEKVVHQLIAEDSLKEGKRYLEIASYTDALDAFLLSIEHDSNNTLAYCGKGNALIALEQYQEALSAFQQAIELASDNVVAYRE